MSLLGITGAIGQGFMAGQNHIAQQDQNAANLKRTEQQTKFDTARLGALNEEMDFNRAERKRVTRLSTLQNQLMQDYPDANDYQRHQMLVDTGVKENLFRGEDLTQAQALRKQMREQFGVEAYDAALAGDIKPLQMLLGERGKAVDFTPDKKGLTIFGQGDQKEVISIDGLLQLDAMGSVREREAARRQQQLENDNKTADTEAKRALANQRNQTAAGKSPGGYDDDGRWVPNPSFTGSRGRGGAGGDDDPTSFDPRDYPHLALFVPKDPLTGEPDSRAFGNLMADAQNIMQMNPNFSGSREQAFNIAARLQLPDDHKEKLRPEPLYDPERMSWVNGVKTPNGSIYLGSQRPVDAYSAAGEPGRAANYDIETEAIAAQAGAMPPKMLEVLGPYLNGTKSIAQIRADESIPPSLREKAEQFVLATRRANEYAPRADARKLDASPDDAPDDVPDDDTDDDDGDEFSREFNRDDEELMPVEPEPAKLTGMTGGISAEWKRWYADNKAALDHNAAITSRRSVERWDQHQTSRLNGTR